jgi:tyrosyl-tRNA synthetase
MTSNPGTRSPLARNAVDVVPAGGLDEKLRLAEKEGRQLRVKFGIDPTTADIHLGHCVPLQKLRDFQDAGHLAVLIIGDYTARVGDPSQRSKTRPLISPEEIDANAKTYQEQAFRILDRDRTEVRFNGEWLGNMKPAELFRLLSYSTVARILERDDFARRYAAQAPISLLELTYPLLQAYDSVAVDADIELGGTDQLYNLLMGRTIMPHYGLEPQVVLTSKILVGTDGTQKMSKSLGNYIGVTDTPGDIFGKAMSIPDEAMQEYLRLAAGLDADTADTHIAELEAGAHPNKVKRALARAVVERLYGADDASAAEQRFDTMFRAHGVPDDAPHVTLAGDDLNEAGKVFLPALIVRHMGVPSNGEARRLLQQGGVKLDGEPLPADPLEVDPATLSGRVLQVGKRRFLRIGR